MGFELVYFKLDHIIEGFDERELMDFQAIYSFLFESYAGLGILVGASLIISVIAAAVMEYRTRKRFVDHADKERDAEYFE